MEVVVDDKSSESSLVSQNASRTFICDICQRHHPISMSISTSSNEDLSSCDYFGPVIFYDPEPNDIPFNELDLDDSTNMDLARSTDSRRDMCMCPVLYANVVFHFLLLR